MILISVQDIQKSFGTHEVLKSVNFSLQKGEKMGLVGVNGCGKTTLMRILTGELEADGGQVHKNKDLRIGYLAQVDDIALTDTVWGALLRVFEPVIAMEKRMKQLEEELNTGQDNDLSMRLTAEYQRLMEKYDEAEAYARKAIAKAGPKDWMGRLTLIQILKDAKKDCREIDVLAAEALRYAPEKARSRIREYKGR